MCFTAATPINSATASAWHDHRNLVLRGDLTENNFVLLVLKDFGVKPTKPSRNTVVLRQGLMNSKPYFNFTDSKMVLPLLPILMFFNVFFDKFLFALFLTIT